MADNIQVTQGTGTTMATDDISGVQYPRVKVSWGVDGSAVDASATNPLPVTSLQLPSTLGQKTGANSTSVVLASDQGNVPVISNNSEIRISANFTRPADTTAYAAGDLVANSTTAGSVVPLSFANVVRTAGDCVRIERVRIEKTSTTLTNASFRLHLFESSPTPTVGDNGVFNSSGTLASNNVLTYAGTFPVTMVWAGSDGAMGIGTPTTGSGATISPTTGTTIYGFIEVTAAYTPASAEVFTVVLEGYRT
jgi:hypothetical protein